MSELFYPHGGGAELATYLYAKLLSQRGFRVVVITNRFDGEPSIAKSSNMMVYRLPLFRGSSNIKYSIVWRIDVLLSSFIRKLIQWADVVYVPRFWYSAILLAKTLKKPVVTHLHDYITICPLANFFNITEDTTCNKKGLMCSQKCIYAYEKMNSRRFIGVLGSTLLNSTFGCFYSKIIGLSDAVVCVSNAQKSLLLRNGAFLPNIYVIYNPLPETTESSQMCGDDFGYFGGPSYLKGFHVLCKAATFARRVNSIKIHATKFYGFNAKDCFQDLGIMVYGKLDSASYKVLYEKVRAVIVPSVWEEPLPYVVSEALISGRIVIASRVGGIPEQVKGCDGAFLVEPRDYKALAERILYINGLSRDQSYELGIKNKEFIMKKFDNARVGHDFSAMLEKVAY
jgi:glycosyltransferase involved in cell wall biosynthesis